MTVSPMARLHHYAGGLGRGVYQVGLCPGPVGVAICNSIALSHPAPISSFLERMESIWSPSRPSVVFLWGRGRGEGGGRGRVEGRGRA